MSAVGVTVLVPPSTGVTDPIPWLIEALVASVVLHVSVDRPPIVIVVGLAVRVASGSTVMVTVSVAVSPSPSRAVSV